MAEPREARNLQNWKTLNIGGMTQENGYSKKETLENISVMVGTKSQQNQANRPKC